MITEVYAKPLLGLHQQGEGWFLLFQWPHFQSLHDQHAGMRLAGTLVFNQFCSLLDGSLW